MATRMNRWVVLAGYGLLAACSQLRWLSYAFIAGQALPARMRIKSADHPGISDRCADPAASSTCAKYFTVQSYWCTQAPSRLRNDAGPGAE